MYNVLSSMFHCAAGHQHNTIHLLFPLNDSAVDNHATSATTTADEAVLVNPRIWCGGKPGYNFNASTENKHPLDLDLWYGDTSPMKNIELGRDTLRCYAVNSNAERFGHEITVLSATLRTDAAHTDAEAMAKFRAQATDARLPLMDWCAMEVWDVKFEAGSLEGWDTAADPVVMCDVSRFCAAGTVVENSVSPLVRKCLAFRYMQEIASIESMPVAPVLPPFCCKFGEAEALRFCAAWQYVDKRPRGDRATGARRLAGRANAAEQHYNREQHVAWARRKFQREDPCECSQPFRCARISIYA